jgi:hypothetical protein
MWDRAGPLQWRPEGRPGNGGMIWSDAMMTVEVPVPAEDVSTPHAQDARMARPHAVRPVELCL